MTFPELSYAEGEHYRVAAVLSGGQVAVVDLAVLAVADEVMAFVKRILIDDEHGHSIFREVC